MTQREKELLARIYTCTNAITGAGPSNPADIGGTARALKRVRDGARPLAMAISNLGYGDLQDAADELDHAERILGVQP